MDRPTKGELKICGLAAVRARFQKEAGSIRRLYFDYPTGRKIGVLCRALSASRKIYRCLEPADMEKVAGTVHHGGIVAVVDEPALEPVVEGEPQAWAQKGDRVLALDRIGNAHNLGAIARTAAFFGIQRIVIPDVPTAARPNDAAYRVAEGGLERVEVRRVSSLPAFLKALAGAGYEVVGAAASGGKSARSLGAPRPGGAPPPPFALVLGNEEGGLSPETAAACTRLVTIPGAGAVESLNVSTAAAVLMWELTGARTGTDRRRPPSP